MNPTFDLLSKYNFILVRMKDKQEHIGMLLNFQFVDVSLDLEYEYSTFYNDLHFLSSKGFDNVTVLKCLACL